MTRIYPAVHDVKDDLSLFQYTKDLFQFTIPVSIHSDSEYTILRKEYLILLARIFGEMLSLYPKKHYPKNTHLLTDCILGIEQSCYQHTLETCDSLLILKNWNDPRFNDVYRCKITRITKNLDASSEVKDIYLFHAIMNRDIDVYTISYLRSDKLSPKRSEFIIRNLQARMEQKLTYKTTKLYKCPKCKKNECTIRMVQLRSLDEGENASLRCIYCHHAWVI